MEKRLKITFLVLTLVLISAAAFFARNSFSKNTRAPEKVENPTLSSKPKEATVPKLSIESIFAKEKADLSALNQEKIVQLIATGDVIPARGANWPAVKSGNFNYNWEKTATFLKTGDLTLINLEAPLLKNCPLQSSGFTFCGDSRQIQGLLFSGVDVANIANNHIGNYGLSGIKETENLLLQNNIEWCGFSRLAIKEAKGVKFGFLGYNGIGTKIDREAVAKEVAEAKTKVDVLVISIHWGEEYVSVPEEDGNIAPDNPREIGHLLVDSGADLIVGNHPHWVQGVEIYKDKLITYAHGNFIFDQTWSAETQEGVVGQYSFYEGKLIAVNYKPIVVDGSYQPVFAEDDRAEKILKQMRESTDTISKLVNP